MKKKMKLLIVILIISIATTISISATYAKYISKIDLTDSARVAKWDLQVEEIEVNLFKDSYIDGAVKSNDGENVVAPGTSGIYQFQITGAPETAYKIRIDVDEANTYDCVRRLKYNIDNKLTTYDIAEAAAYLQGYIYNSDAIHDPNTKAEGDGTGIHTISWVWEFNESDALNKEDTDLGRGIKNYNTRKDDAGKIVPIPQCQDKARVGLAFKITAEQATK